VDKKLEFQAHTPLPKPSPSAVFKYLAEGAVLFSTSDEVYFGLNAVGARIWELLPPVTSTFGELCQELAGQYPDVDLRRIQIDASQFLRELTQSGLVIFREANASDAPAVREQTPESR
jgi:hypothetical protein